MESLEKNTGILTKDFIKKLVNREKELENTIFELGEQIKALKSSKDNTKNDIPKGYDIFINMIKCASINLSLGDDYCNMPTLSIEGYPIRADEIEYIKRLIEERENTEIKPTYCYRTDVGIGRSPRWLNNLANDRA